METLVFREHLKEALETTERISVKSPALPILNNVLLSAKKEQIELRATDLQIGVIYRFLGTTKQEGAVAFQARPLASLLALSGEEHVSLSRQDKDLLVATGSYRVSLKTVDEEEFPIIPSAEASDPFVEIETGLLCDALGQVAGMTGQSQARPEISGVLFVFEKKRARVAATDSFRLAERKFELGKEAPGEHRFILPAKTVREAIAILGGRPGKTTIHFSPTQTVFTYEATETPSRLGIQVVSRIIEGEYPNYEEVIPATQKTLLTASKNEFADHLKAAGIFSGKTLEVRIAADPARKEITFSAESSEQGGHESKMKGEISGEAVQVAFNWRFLNDGLAQVRGERVELRMNGEEGPAVLRGADQEDYVYVIMPIKV